MIVIPTHFTLPLSAAPGDELLLIGDIHGRADLLTTLLETAARIERRAGTRRKLIFTVEGVCSSDIKRAEQFIAADPMLSSLIGKTLPGLNSSGAGRVFEPHPGTQSEPQSANP